MLTDEKRAVELSFDTKEDVSLLGNIYVGKVASIVKNIGAAFIEIEGGLPCYFSLADNTEILYTKKSNSPRLTVGDELLVQVSREPQKTKAPTVTANITFTGKYLVLTSAKKQIGISTKLDKAKKQQLTEQMQCLKDERFGWIVRTNAAEVPFSVIEEEAARLRGEFEMLLQKGIHSPARSCLSRNPQSWLLHLKDLYSDQCAEIITDSEELYADLKKYLETKQPEDAGKLTFYQDRLLPLYKLYCFETEFANALKERVWLKSGAYLVIQPTEALTVIDVNTGKYERGKNVQETYYKINCEAAAEIARQLRLRSLSGIILIDFINMDIQEYNDALMEELRKHLKYDPLKACAVDMTALGLVEVTRKRKQKPLAERMRSFKENG